MSARPPRASTRSDARTDGKPERADAKPERAEAGPEHADARPERADARPAKRARTRGATNAERDSPGKPRSSSVIPTDRYERIGDDDVLEVTDVADGAELAAPRLRMLVLEAALHLAPAQAAIVAAGHAVAIGAAGRDGIDKLRFAVGEVDAMLVGMPGGEPLIEAALALGGRRPIVIAAWTASAVEAIRRSAAAGADLAAVRPHDVERLAPVLFAAGRLAAQRRRATAAAPDGAALDVPAGDAPDGDAPAPRSAGAAPGAASGVAARPAGSPRSDSLGDALADILDAPAAGSPRSDSLGDALADILGDDLGGDAGVDVEIDLDADLDSDSEPAGLLPAERFAQAAQRELERARHHGHPLAVALFAVDVPPPPPPPALRGILRARAGNAVVHALRAVDLATELDQDRFLVVMPEADRAAAAEHARRIISAVAAGDPVTAVGRTFPPRVIGAVAAAQAGDALDLPRLVRDATQLLEQAQVTGASLAVET